MLSRDRQLPPAGNDFTEREVAKGCQYRWTDWVLIHPTHREKMIAHELHRNMRDAYNAEQARKAANPKKNKEHADPMNRILAAFGSKIIK